MLSKNKLADFVTRVLLDREAQTPFVKGIVEFPSRLPATGDRPETLYASVASIIADEFHLTRSQAVVALEKLAQAKPNVFGWQLDVRTVNVRDPKTGQPTGQVEPLEVHHLWLRDRMRARLAVVDPLARASAEVRARIVAS
jgi:hypothetical protein